ncbi:hypothetical protein C8Q78DRAFT_980440 [Trametes maxima]|nr:hypothetical protein C8Q78DRAFT_980440 [Trametes maxima]
MATHYARTVAHIDELLVMIFAYLDDRALSRAACVCKHWSEIALDGLWHEVHDLRRALAVLAPLALKPERAFASTGRPPNAYAFRRPLTPDDWQRFRRYSIRVRRIRHDQRRALTTAELARRHVPLHSKIFDDLSATCPYPDIFPNLQSLIWFSCAPERQHFSLAFMHRRVKHLGLHLYRSEPGSSTGFLHQVCSRCVGVTSLEVRMEAPIRQLEDDALILLRGLCHLQQVSFPLFSITPRILVQLSGLRCLEAISLGHPAQAQPGDRTDVAEFSPIIADDGFVTLRSLAFGAQVPDVTRLLNTALFPAKLTRLHLKSVATASPAVVRDFFCAIQERCISLVNLSLDYIIAPDSALVSPPPPLHERPALATFRPLFRARALRIFEFRWDFALNLSDDDMDEFARSWPSLESLQLNPEPVPEPDGPKLSLRALVPFARHCANLRYLALYVDARTVPDIPPMLRTPRLVPFQRLETFAVGLSIIAKPEPVTLFLSQLLPLGCAVRCGLRWPDAFDLALEHALVPLDVRTEMNTFWMCWTEVAKMLPIATKARLEEKATYADLERKMRALEVSRSEDQRRLSDLEREVVDLRGRTGRTP